MLRKITRAYAMVAGLMRFLAGFISGLLALFGYWGYENYIQEKRPCGGHCGAQTECVNELCQNSDAPSKKRKKRRRSRRRRKKAVATSTVDQTLEPALKTPTGKDLKSISKGPSLKGIDRMDMNEADLPELNQDLVEKRYRAKDSQILSCIAKARSGWAIEKVLVKVGFRIEPTGQIKKVRVQAPTLMQNNGLHTCIKKVVTSLRFARSSRSLVISYPYRLE
jgi:hypothetical protein